ncbi:hypothetical protein [Marinobacter salexigens]|uniref:Uncharacterized protein n=1 Tax=Marinobacter salexigens TaxID=1925763 RepID=A0ABS6AB72_9GAMM|nr:hypothetical protein [Marinobacter salexigens]MBU2875281.1 hypothetical protein [Marinobacter salexigens]
MKKALGEKFEFCLLVILSTNLAYAEEVHCACGIDAWSFDMSKQYYYFSGIWKEDDRYSCNDNEFVSYVMSRMSADGMDSIGVPWCAAFPDYYSANDERVARGNSAESSGHQVKATNWKP